jgi:hypothetical protein
MTVCEGRGGRYIVCIYGTVYINPKISIFAIRVTIQVSFGE